MFLGLWEDMHHARSHDAPGHFGISFEFHIVAPLSFFLGFVRDGGDETELLVVPRREQFKVASLAKQHVITCMELDLTLCHSSFFDF